MLLANLPRFLHWMENEAKEPEAAAAAEVLAQMADRQGMSEISQTLRGLISRSMRSDEDFAARILGTISNAYFPEKEYSCLVFLMGLLTNKLPWFKIKTLQLLCMLIPHVDMRKPEITSKGPDLISPVLRLLQTEYCPQALAVLDNVMTMNATPLDNKHLRMSMMGANTSRAARKEYEKTQSLYGIPEESGWAVPVPAIHSAATRSNVHAVFYTCASPGVLATEQEATPNIELVEDHTSYFPEFSRTHTMTSDEPRDMHTVDLNKTLEEMDDLFDDDTPPSSQFHGVSSTGFGKFPPTGGDVGENLYEEQTYPILRKSLNRNASVSSFQNGFSDLRISPSREAMIMTPTAFMADNVSPSMGPPGRPSMHARSQTSPAVNHNSPPGTAISSDEAIVDDPGLSDDDMPGTRHLIYDKQTMVSVFEHENRPRQGGLRSGFRSGIRRLTGGSDEKERARARDAMRAQMEKSPVPKVPDMYLRDPKSADP
jgi:hypothetical protein